MELKTSSIETPLGPMIAIADDNKLHLLEFLDSKGLEREINRLSKNGIVPEKTQPIINIEKEIAEYFVRRLTKFETPLHLSGTAFQVQVWEALMKIPYGETCSYGDLAKAIGKPTAFRAVARANATNQLAIIIPCHRVINTNGNLGGYAGGVKRKEWMIHHENKIK